MILEREGSAGGIPRHTRHAGYGLRDLHRVMTGSAYARHYAKLAQAAGAEIRTSTMVTQWQSPGLVSSTSSDDLTTWHARAILLATG